MKLLSRYVSRQWLFYFCCFFCALSCLTLLEEIYKNFYSFFKAGISSLELLKYCGTLPIILSPIIIPTAIFFATFFTINFLHKKNEIAAMWGAGMSSFQIAQLIIIYGLALTAIGLLLEMLAIPHASKYITSVKIDIKNKLGKPSLARKLGFYNGRDFRAWFLGELDKTSNEATDIFVSCFDGLGNEKKRIFAKHAMFSEQQNCWIFKEGSTSIVDEICKLPVEIETFTEKIFSEFTENPEIMLAGSKSLKNISLKEANELLKYTGRTKLSKALDIKIHKLFSKTVEKLIILLFAVMFATGINIRSHPLKGLIKAIFFLCTFFIFSEALAIFSRSGIFSSKIAVWLPQLIIIPVLTTVYKK